MQKFIALLTKEKRLRKNEEKYDVYVYAHNPFNKVIKF